MVHFFTLSYNEKKILISVIKSWKYWKWMNENRLIKEFWMFINFFCQTEIYRLFFLQIFFRSSSIEQVVDKKNFPHYHSIDKQTYKKHHYHQQILYATTTTTTTDVDENSYIAFNVSYRIIYVLHWWWWSIEALDCCI